MRKFNIVMSGLMIQAMTSVGQVYMAPEEGYKTSGFLSAYTSVSAFDIYEGTAFIHDGDTIHMVDVESGMEIRKFGEPADYSIINYASFLTIAPGGKHIWTGYTSDGNADDRIYSIEIETGQWQLQARFPGNFDLLFWKESILVSGLNSATLGESNAIFTLDTTGQEMHRKIMEVGGNSAGMAIDTLDNLYYGTSFSAAPNAIYRWADIDLESVITSPGALPLNLSHAIKLTDVPAGVYDCEMDEGFNLLFNMNLFGSEKVLAMWNRTWGDGYNLDTLAVASGDWDWLGTLKSMGDVTDPTIGERIVTFSFGRPLVDLHTADYPPVLTRAVPVISGYDGAALEALDLTQYITDPDDLDGFTFDLEANSDPAVADLRISERFLVGTFGQAGQTKLTITALSGEETLEIKTVLGSWPVIEGDHKVAGFEELSLDPEGYWNGNDGSGSFVSGPVRFRNDYNPDWYSWSGWACSRVTDNTSPGWANQYSAITGEGFDKSENYGVSYATIPSVIGFAEDKAHAVEGVFVTNATYAALSIEHGDDFTKKFGGEFGTDPDFFRLDIWGTRHGVSTDTIGYYLADYRFEETYQDYIIKTWQWVDLSSLGKVDSLHFALASSDMGAWGMNTPGYFCIDNLYVLPDAVPFVANPIGDLLLMSDGRDTIIEISYLFSDPDDDDAQIVKTIASNSNEEMLEASIEGDNLMLRGRVALVKSSLEEVEIVVEGNSGGFTVTDTFQVSLDFPDGIEKQNDFGIRLFPNPSHGSVVIESATSEPMEVTIIGMTGTGVYANREYLPRQPIDLSHLPAGPYIIKIRKDSYHSTKLIQIL